MTKTKTDLIPQKDIERIVGIMKAVAHPMRLQIVNILMKGEHSVGVLVNMLGTKQSLTSQQLTILKHARIVKPRRNGNVVFYSLENNGIKKIMATILKVIS